MAKTYHQAFEIIILSIIDNFTPEPWQEYREEVCWTCEVDEIFTNNLDSMQKIYADLFPKIMMRSDQSLRACIDLFYRGTGLGIT